MKKVILNSCISLVILFLSTEIVFAQSSNDKKIKDKVVGIWQHTGVIFHSNDNITGSNKFMPCEPVAIKIIFDDGTYKAINISKYGFVMNGYGRYKITSDSIYIEQVESHLNSTMTGKENKMVISFSPDGKTMSNKFLLEKLSTGDEVNVELTEFWERVEMPSVPVNQPLLNVEQKGDEKSDKKRNK